MLRRPPPAAASSPSHASPPQIPFSPVRRRRPSVGVRCGGASDADAGKADLGVGSPIVVVEAPPMLKTAASVPSLRCNDGLVKPGDVGRIMARRPKDVWAVRLAAGAYLLDGKHFKPLDVGNDKDDHAATTK